MTKVVVFIPYRHWLADAAITLCSAYPQVERAVLHRDDHAINSMGVVSSITHPATVPPARFYVNFLTRWKFTHPDVLARGLNIHPGPPRYPGVGAPSRAILNGDKDFGVTLHRITAEFDAGRILHEMTFDIYETWSVEQLHRTAELRSLEMLNVALARLTEWHSVEYDKRADNWFERDVGMRWDKYWSRKDLEDALTLDLDDDAYDEDGTFRVNRHVNALAYPGKLGPYLIAGGRRWRLDP